MLSVSYMLLLFQDYLSVLAKSVSESQSLRPLSSGARAASPRKRRAPQALASNREGNQTCLIKNHTSYRQRRSGNG